VGDDDVREVQLTLTNRFKNLAEEQIDGNANLLAETKELVINVLKVYPTPNKRDEHEDRDLIGVMQEVRQYAKDKDKKVLADNVNTILANIKKLEAEGMVTGADNYAAFLRAIALEVANRQEIRDQQRKEIKRLTAALRNLRKHHDYMREQIEQYNTYLKDVLLHYGPSKPQASSKASKPVKFSYKSLEKKGVLVDSVVPKISRKHTDFYISQESPGVYTVKAKIGTISVDSIELFLDDLLEKHNSNIQTINLSDQVTLDVNMTLFLINKLFIKG